MADKRDKQPKSDQVSAHDVDELDDAHKSKRDVEDELDAGLEGTFPASDPVAISQPTTATPQKRDKPAAEAGNKTRDAVENSAPPRRVNVSETEEIRYWTQRFGVSEEELKEAVRTVGFIPADVAAFLGKPL
ncbi:MAG TPA: DUF3606 domain-containing protein [Ferrovibrio sp.]|uniref:DUF3606 domain-containing protein n=1 Tax=Ferrovibrio sp. TaxID=1917215 RepID=UPI002ED2ED3E